MTKKLLINPYKVIPKHKRTKYKPKINWKREEPEPFWPKSDFNDVFEADPRAWEPIFFRNTK